jgi:hypothetical protein
MVTLLEAMLAGDEANASWCDPNLVQALARRCMRAQPEDQIIDVPLVRSLIAPLWSGERAVFRDLVAGLGRAVIRVDAAGIDGSVSDPLQSRSYWELKALLGALNGVLRATRSGVGSHAQRELVTA